MKIDYKKLTEDLLKAKEAAKKAVKGEDGGTANLDSMTIALPGSERRKGYTSCERCRPLYER